MTISRLILFAAAGRKFEPIVATGGSVLDIGGYRVHTFTSSGNFVVTSVPSGQKVDVLIVAGGGSGGGMHGGGGGGGGVVYKPNLEIAAGSYVITVGSGGSSVNYGSNAGNNGQDSAFSACTAKGGGGGGGDITARASGLLGGAGAAGAVRIIWGVNREFPSTNTGDI